MKDRSQAWPSPCFSAQVQNAIPFHSPLFSRPSAVPRMTDTNETQFSPSEPRRRNRYTKKYSQPSCPNSKEEACYSLWAGVGGRVGLPTTDCVEDPCFPPKQTSTHSQNTSHTSRFHVLPYPASLVTSTEHFWLT